MKRLIMMVGLPRSGKSTIAKDWGAPIVNPDSIRLAIHGQRFLGQAEPLVWATAKIMVAALFEAGHETVILDATNTTVDRRNEWIDKRWRRMFHIVDTPREVCLGRADMLEDESIKPIIEKMAAHYEPPMQSEYKSWEV